MWRAGQRRPSTFRTGWSRGRARTGSTASCHAADLEHLRDLARPGPFDLRLELSHVELVLHLHLLQLLLLCQLHPLQLHLLEKPLLFKRQPLLLEGQLSPLELQRCGW